MKVHGKCHCGKIEFHAEVDPEKVSLCHCTDCQVMTGTAYRVSARINAGDFHLTKGQPKIYIKTPDSGVKRVQAFCGDCATPLYAEPVENPKSKSLRIGCLAERAFLPPKQQTWCGSALTWSFDVSHVSPQYVRGDTTLTK